MLSTRTTVKLFLMGGIFSTFLATVFQNCSQVNFDTTDELIKAGIDGELRFVSLYPEQKESRPSINVTTILDNSNSMKPIQDQVASAFQSVTKQLRGFSGEMTLFTTTQSLNGNKSSLSYKDFIRYQMGGNILEIPLGQLNTLSPSMPYSKIRKYSIGQSQLLSGYSIPFWMDMSDQEFDDFTNEYTTSISNIGVDGDDKEQGICSLIRAARANKSSQAFEAFILATNEDDVTDVDTCLDEEIQNVQKVPKSPSQVKCEANDTNCSFKYQLSYIPKKDNKINYKYRSIAESVKYTTNQIIGDYKLEYKYNSSKKYVYYKTKEHKEWISFRSNYLNDNLPEPNLNIQIFNLNGSVPQPGYCEGGDSTNGNEISCSEVESLIPLELRTYGLVPGSCKIHCQNSISGEKNKLISSHTGSCSQNDDTEGYQSCSMSDNDVLNSLLNGNSDLIASCRHRCVTSVSSPKTIKLGSKPGNCSQSCNGSQLSSVKDVLPSGFETKDLSYCTVKCSESNVGGTINLSDRSVFQCSGMGEQQSGNTGAISCMSDNSIMDKISQMTGKNKSEIKSCSYTCSQTIGSQSKLVSNDSQCNLGTNGCSTGDWNTAVNHYLSTSGTNELFMIPNSCTNSCMTGAGTPTCKNILSINPNLCENPSLTEIQSLCGIQSHEVDMNSCSRDEGLKLVNSNDYDSIEEDVQNLKIFENKESIVSDTAEYLKKSFNGRFFVAQFIVPPGDENCKPENSLIDPGFRYGQLANALGEGSSKVFPVCLNSYEDSLSFVLDLITRWVGRSYQLGLDLETEFVWRVNLIKENGQVKELEKDLYKIDSGVLNFNEEVDLTDVIRIDVQIVTPRSS